MNKMIPAVLIVLLLPAGAFAADRAAQGGPGHTRLAVIDLRFLRDNAADALGDIALGRLASSRGVSPDVRRLGGELAAKAESLLHGLARVAQERDVGLPQAPSRAAEDQVRALSGLSGERFDRAFVEAAFQDLRDDQVRLLRRAHRRGEDSVALLARVSVEPTRTVLSMARRLHDEAMLAEARDDQQNAYMPRTERDMPR